VANFYHVTGKRVLLNGGLQWAPFFQDRREFYQRVGPHTALPALFALLFTEISVFMFEDATMLSIWIATDSFDKGDNFDRLNSWFTLLSVVMCLSLLLSSILAWLRFWIWESDACSIACQIISAVAFLIIFGIIVVFLVSLVFMGFQTIAGKELTTQGPFFILVCLSWVFGSFFACTLRQESRVPLIQSASWCDDDPACDIMMVHGQEQHDATHSSNVESSGQSNIDNTSSSSEPSVSTETPEVMIMISTNFSCAAVDVEANIPFAEAVVLLEDPIGDDSSPKIDP
jgi:hypothetical protein